MEVKEERDNTNSKETSKAPTTASRCHSDTEHHSRTCFHWPRKRRSHSQAEARLDAANVSKSPSNPLVKLVSSISLKLENNGSVARDHLASERTFLAYVRTSLGCATMGVGTSKQQKVPAYIFSILSPYSTGPVVRTYTRNTQNTQSPSSRNNTRCHHRHRGHNRSTYRYVILTPPLTIFHIHLPQKPGPCHRHNPLFPHPNGARLRFIPSSWRSRVSHRRNTRIVGRRDLRRSRRYRLDLTHDFRLSFFGDYDILTTEDRGSLYILDGD